MAKWDLDKLPPGREPLRADWFVEKLGQSQQQVMSLTLAKRRLENAVSVLENRADFLEEVLTEAFADLKEGRDPGEVREVLGAALTRLDEDLGN